jgi:hypothetical protein
MLASSALAIGGTKDATATVSVICEADEDCETGFVCVSNACVAETCGIDSASDVTFGDLKLGSTGTERTSIVSTVGTVNSDMTLYGTDWTTGFEVGYTHYSLSTGEEYSDMTEVPDSGTSADLGEFVKNAGTPVYFRLSVPTGLSTGGYSQTLTFTASC